MAGRHQAIDQRLVARIQLVSEHGSHQPVVEHPAVALVRDQPADDAFRFAAGAAVGGINKIGASLNSL